MNIKKIFGALVAIVLVVCVAVSSVHAVVLMDNGYKYGDLNMDGCLTEEDADTALDIYAKIIKVNDTYLKIGDMNGDGVINDRDSRIILKYVQDASNFPNGDINRDGCLTEEDCKLMLKVVRGEIDNRELYTELADMDGNGRLDTADYNALIQYVQDTSKFTKGDVNRDGSITEYDSDMVVKIYNGNIDMKDIYLELADMNGDGVLDSNDSSAILRYAQNINNFVKGDVNRDGLLNKDDADYLLKVIEEKIKYRNIFLKLGDMNNDGYLDERDVRAILHYSIPDWDIDGDGKVNANDASIILDLFKNENATDVEIVKGDMDGNGVLNANDASMILDYYKNLSIVE